MTTSSCASAYELDHLFLRLMDTCNLECAHCYASCGPRAPDHLELDAVLGVIDQLRDVRVRHVHLEGGEALMYRHFWRVLDALEEVAVRPAITSNGLLTKPALLARLCERVEKLTFSIDGHCADVHDQIRRRAGSFDRVVQSVRDSLALGIETHIISVVWKRSVAHAGELVALAEDLGVQRMLLFSCGRIGAAKEHWEELAPDDEQWNRFLWEVRELSRSRPWLWFELDRVPRDQLRHFLPAAYRPVCTERARRSLTIDPRGEAYPCGYFIPYGKTLGNVRDVPLRALIDAGQDGERYSGACRDPWAQTDGAVHLCKIFSINAERLPVSH